MRKKLEKLPLWLLMLIGLIMVGVLGYVDCITGDYSLLIFYAIPVTMAGWCVGRWGAVAMSVAAGVARLASDYISYHGASFKYWNSLQDMVFLLMVGLLVALMKELMSDAYRNRE